MNNILEIDGKKYRIKETFRAIMEYEKSQSKQSVETLEDQIKIFYYILKNANRKKNEELGTMRFTMGFEGFLDILDEDMTLIENLTKATAGEEQSTPEDEDKKK